MLSIQLFGGFRLRYAEQDVEGIQSERLVLLLSHLLLHSDQPPSRKQLAFLFWPDSTEEQARTNLRNLFHLLRRAFPEIDSFLEVDSQSVRWRSGAAIQWDVKRFQDALANAKAARDDSTRVRHLQEAAELYRGELLPGFYEDWILVQREELHQAYLSALAQLAKLLEDARQYEDAIEAANRLLRADPLNEAAYAQSMRLHALNDDRAGALQVYHACAATLKMELGIEPSAELKALREQLLRSAEAEPLPAQPAAQGQRLIGRKREWERLRETWHSSQKGRAQMAAILGEAGIGKTRLANELKQWAQRQGIQTAFAQCYPLEGNLPFAPIVAWLRAEGIRGELDALAPLWKKEIARLLPELEEAESAGGQRWQRQRLFEALARGLLGSGAPRLLMLDDMQWCDQETLEFLHYLLRYDASAKALVLATVRLEEVDEQHPLTHLRNALRTRGQLIEIELAPLNKDEVGLLASDLLGRDLDEETETRLFAETEGNPFFAVEALRSGVHERAGTLPPTLRSVLMRRLGQLSPSARDLVGLAAVIGREFDFSLLAAASQMEENPLVQALDELWARRIIQIQQGDTYVFSHGKLQEAAYDSLSTTRRPLLHRRVAETLLARNGESALIASHFEQAGKYSLAVEHYLNAAEEARRVFANQNAAAYLERALILLREKVGLASETQKRLACQALETLGDLYGMGSKEASAIPSFAAALDLLPPSETLRRARLIGKLARVTGNRDPQKGRDLFARAEEELGKPSEARGADWWDAWFTIQFARIWMHYDSNDLEGMRAAFETIEPFINRLEDTDQLAEYYFLLPTLSFRRDGYLADESMRKTAALALELSQKGGNLELQTRTNFGYGFIQFLLGDFEAAIQYLAEGLRLARQIGYVEQEAYCVTYLAAAHRCAGHLEECRVFCEQGLALCEREEFKSFASTAIANLGWIAWKQNDLKKARQLSQNAAAGWSPNYPFRWYGLWTLMDLNLLSLRVNDAVECARQLKAAGQQVFAQEGDALLTGAISAAEAGDMQRAESLLAQAVDWAKKNHYL